MFCIFLLMLFLGEVIFAASPAPQTPISSTLSSQRGLKAPLTIDPLFSPPGESATPRELEAWDAALQTETEYVSNFIEGLVNTEIVDEAHGSLENLLKPELVKAYSENIVGTSGIGIAEKVYKEVMRQQDEVREIEGGTSLHL